MSWGPDEQTPGLVPGAMAARTVEDLAVLLRRLRRREARRREGAELTYRQLAAKAGWSHALVAAYFCGKILPPTDRFDTLVRVLGATPAEQGALATARDRVEDGRRARAGPPRTGAEPPVPQQLPADVIGFVGRTAHLDELDDLLEMGRHASAVVISAVSGTAGVGKTALAVHWAHGVRNRFPDGILYADMHGYGPGTPAGAERILDRFLADLGAAPAEAPRDVDAKSALYRSLLDGRRVLVLLDNAVSPQQVRPLLPGSASCLVLVTSRSMLTGLVARDRARRIVLEVLPLADSVDLLAGFAGAARVAAEPGAAAELARLCACLPVALCVAGERAAARPDVALSVLAGELTAGSRLDLLDAGNDHHTAVRAVFSWSYRDLPAPAARMFRLLGTHPGRDIDRHSAAALAGTDLERAHRLLDALAAVNLIRQRRPGRYDLHDLLRAYAAERAREDEAEADRRAGLTRLFDYVRSTAAEAMDVVFAARRDRRPGGSPVSPRPSRTFADPFEAKAWLDVERPNLLLAIAHAAANGWPAHAYHLAATLSDYLYFGAHYADALEIHAHALEAARRQGDRSAEGMAMVNLGHAELAVGRPARSRDLYESALAIFCEIGDRAGQAQTLQRLGVLHRVQGRHAEACEHLDRSVAGFRALGDRLGEANALGALGETNAERGEYTRARDGLERALGVARELGDRVGEGNGLGALGEVYRRWGRHQEAAEHFRRALAIFRALGNRRAEARVHNGLGEALRAAGQDGEAMTHYRSALAVAREVGDPYEQGSALDRIAVTQRAAGDREGARHHWTEALAVYADLNVPETDEILARLAELDEETASFLDGA